MAVKENKNLSIQYYGESDLGLVRTENQDSFGKFPSDSNDLTRHKGLLFIVADGMGGHIGGREASQSAVKIVSREYFTFSSELISNCLRYAFKNANIKIFHSSKGDMQFQKKGTTCTALVLEQDLAHIAHVGDSRIYKITDEGIEQLTDDHTQVEEMLKKGIISKEEAKNHPAKSVLVRALGIDSDIEVDIKENIPLKVGQNFVLCSDGLARVKKEEIKQIVSSNSPSDACKKLIQLAIERGGHDNITVQIIKICEDNKKLVSKDKGTDRKSSKRWFKFSIISVILIVILLLGLFFIKDINNLFSTKTILDNKPLGINNVDSYDGSSQTLMDKANYWFTIGQFDSALVSYNLILIDNPMHVGALNGIEMISNQYISQGKILMEQKKYEDALAYYRKAEELKSNDQKLQNLILFCEEKIQVLNSEQQSQRNNYLGEKNNLEENSTNLSDTENKDNLKGKSDISKIELSEWNFESLTESDFNLYENGIIFLNTDQDKKAIFQHTKEDVDIAVELKFKANRLGDRAGIIIGYNEDLSDKDSYFLYTVERTGKFLLRKISGNNEEKLLIVEKPGEYNDHFFLKIKCLGPWLMIYNNDKLLDSWLNKEFIKGKIGLFVEGQTYADFSNFNVSSAFKNKTKN